MRRLAALLCVFALGALAEEPASPAAEDAAARPAAPAASPSVDAGKRSQPRAETATAATGKSPDRFDPSEQISEDLSVSFPTDI